MRAYSKKDVDKKALKGARIAVVGYGSQGRAHALNLKDSGYDVVIGVRKGDSWKKAKKDGLAVMVPAEAVKGATLVSLLAPDTTQAELYKEILPSLGEGATLLFAHGFNIHFAQIKPRKDLDVVLIAPKGPGDLVRRQFQQGRGVPCLIAVHRMRRARHRPGARLCRRYRRYARRSHRDDLCRGDRDGPVRRAGRALRRRH